jgi:5-(carboxyamino)imidazole ribonucleotide synthase
MRLKELENQGVKVVPNSKIIKIIQQKILQKQFYEENRIPSPEFEIMDGSEDEIKIQLPFVQKLNTGGYDGKGVQLLRSNDDWRNLWTQESVLENLVDIDKELSVIVAKNENGEDQNISSNRNGCRPKTESSGFQYLSG